MENTVSWQVLNLTAPEFAKPSEPPWLCGLIYRAKRHAISGPPEAAKTLAALTIALEARRHGALVAFIDFESGPAETRRLLEDLGATAEEIADVLYIEADSPPDESDLERWIIAQGVELTIIDAAAGAYEASGLDEMKRGDIEKFARTWVQPLWRADIATLLVDHVVKNADNRGKFAIGGERKLGGVDVHLGLHAVKQLHRGGDGLIRISTHKDRPAWLSRPTAAELVLRSDPKTHAISWDYRQPAAESEPEGWRPTALMERVSRHLEQHGPKLKTAIYDDVKGKTEYLVEAVAFLLQDGYALPVEGKGRSPQIRIDKPYREPFPDVSPFSQGLVNRDVSPFPSSKEGTGNGSRPHHEPTAEDLEWWAAAAREAGA